MSNQLIHVAPPVDAQSIIRNAEICESTAQEVTKPAFRALMNLVKYLSNQNDELRQALTTLLDTTPQPIVDVPTDAAATVEAYRGTVL